MKKVAFPVYLIAFLIFSLSCSDIKPIEIKKAEASLPEKVDFNFHIKPLLSDRCFKCHGPDANQRKGDLRLDIAEIAFAKSTADGSLAPYILSKGNLQNSEVFHRIISEDAAYMMPPPKSNLSLNWNEKALIARWIEQGAEYKPHWAFVAPEKPALPKVKNKNWATQPFDHFILHKMEEMDLSPSEKAPRATLFRRITLDLTGLSPSPQDLDDFLKDDSPDAYERAIDRLLESPHYGERLALEWLDVARYADSHGYQDDGMRNTWPWRDWVIQSFNKNMPYNQFLVEQLAGDLLDNPTKDQLLATCFNRNHPQTQEGGVVDEEYRIEYVADRTNTFGKALLGMTIECARCHDHKYDPISQKEYYSLFAFFNNNNDTGIVPYNGEASPTIQLPSPETQAKLEALKAKIEPLEKALLSDNYVADFKKWLDNKDPQIDLKEGLVAVFGFDKELKVNSKTLNLDGKKKSEGVKNSKNEKITSYLNEVKNKADAEIYGDKDMKPLLVEGKKGKAIHFQGDAGVRFNRDLDFDRHQAFSVSIWIKVLKEGEEGPIFNNTNGDFEGYRGWLCKLNPDGSLSFQFNHVWPDNCIDYQTRDKIKIGEWTHIAMTYNGNSKAEGLRFFINGEQPDFILHRDNLNKSLLHGVKGSNWSDLPFILGMELRKSIENVVMDELMIYDREISELEVKKLFDGENPQTPSEDDLLEYYLVSGKNQRLNQNLSQLTQLRKEVNLITTDIMEVMVMNDRKEARPTFILNRGAYDAPTQQVEASTPAILTNLPKDYPKNRLGLAKWLVASENPLTARVAVNRFWAMLFGKGLVATQEDFGGQGNLPTHPELMDWLAVNFMENNWEIKAFLKQILLSSTYQQSSNITDLAKEIDPGNDWYSHFPVYRLSAETIRDNALEASGLLVKKIGGPSVYPYQPKGIWEALATRNATEYKQGTGEDLYRRSMYTIWKRSSPPPSMMSFDAPDRYYCVVRRQKTSTPLQSFILMNDPQFIEAARMLGERAMQEGRTSVNNKLEFIFKSLIGRRPIAKELSILDQLYRKELVDFKTNQNRIKALLSTGEHALNPTLNKPELAAYTVIATTIMNFDEFVMKR